LAAEVLAEERRKFEEEVIALQREVRERQQGMEQAYAEAIATVRENVIAILQNLVEQRGIDVVLPRSGYLVANRELDLTDEILGELNQVLPSLTLDLP
ncbi:MAG: OmpH family outer membrane protein, partial [Rhodospirillaceae bacterium]|nr:OmpH family outer membrane protein [Rhodospirillaceae bacterium]